MSQEFLPFSKPALNQAAIDEVTACLQSGWLATGPRVAQFEQDLQKYLHAEYAMALNSATAGLHLCLKKFVTEERDEVITTPMTFVATLNTIVQAGGKPVLVDVDLDTYNIDIEKIAAAITPRTCAIMPVHFAGVPVDLDPIYELAAKYNLRVLEDAAQAIGGYYKGKIIGSFGDTQVFSFHPNKVITSGEGGCVTTRDAELAKNIGVLRFHGIDREAFNRYAKGGSQYYDVIQPGFKYNMMDIQAAIGIHQLRELEQFIAQRRKLTDRYNEVFANWQELVLPKSPQYACRCSFYLYAPLINVEKCDITRDEFMQAMQEYNIGVGYHYRAAHLFSFYRDNFEYRPGQFPNAELISERIVSLPLFATMTFAEQDRVIEAMAKIFKK